jgi:hypothetical protein
VTASATTTAATIAAAPPASAATFTLRARLIDHERAAEELLPVEGRDGLFGLGVVANFRKSEAARLSCKPIAKKGERIRLNADF